MASDIGYQDGINAFEEWFRKLSKFATDYNKWTVDFMEAVKNDGEIPAPPKFPAIPLEGPNFKEEDISTWPWPRKFFRNTMRKLKDYYDAVNPNGGSDPSDPPDPPDPLPPAKSTHAPLAYNEAPGGEPSARYNIRINCKPHPTRGDRVIDNGGVVYDLEGRCTSHRDTIHVDGLKAANMMDQKEAWEPYEWFGLTVGPGPNDYPDACYNY